MSHYREQARINFPPSFHSFSSLDGSLLCRMDTLVFAVKWSLYHQNSNYYTNTFYTQKNITQFCFIWIVQTCLIAKGLIRCKTTLAP